MSNQQPERNPGKVTKQSRRPGSNRMGTNMFSKNMRVISDEYRKGYDSIKWNKE